MKILSFLLLFAFAGWAFTNKPASLTMSVLTDRSKIEWAATKKTGFHQGIIKIKSGEVQVENNKLTGGKFTIDVASISATDFEKPTENDFVKHLLSPDFLETAKYPEATFEITKVDYKDEKNAILNGNFTMKGITLPLAIPAIINSADEKRFFGYAHFTFDRTLWGVNYDPARASKDVNIGVYLFALPPSAAK